jgi:hypothetical protein
MIRCDEIFFLLLRFSSPIRFSLTRVESSNRSGGVGGGGKLLVLFLDFVPRFWKNRETLDWAGRGWGGRFFIFSPPNAFPVFFPPVEKLPFDGKHSTWNSIDTHTIFVHLRSKKLRSPTNYAAERVTRIKRNVTARRWTSRNQIKGCSRSVNTHVNGSQLITNWHRQTLIIPTRNSQLRRTFNFASINIFLYFFSSLQTAAGLFTRRRRCSRPRLK